MFFTHYILRTFKELEAYKYQCQKRNARVLQGTSTVTRQNVTKIHLGGFCRGTSKGGVAGHQPVSVHDTVGYGGYAR